MTEPTPLKKAPFQFDRAIFMPFRHGDGSTAFVVRSALLFAVCIAAVNLIFGGAAKDAAMAFNTLNAEMATSGSPTAQWWSGFGKMMLAQLPMFMVMWVVWAMIEAALHRRVLLHEDGGNIPWRFGGDELRVMLCQLVTYPLWFVAWMFIYIVLAAIFGTIGTLISPGLGMVLIALSLLASLFLSSAFVIRFAAASAFSVANKRLGFGASWEATKRRVLPSFGAYALVMFVGFIIYFIIAMILMTIMFGGEFSQMWQGAIQGDTTASNALYADDSFLLKQTVQGALLGLYLTVFSLIVAGIGSHIAALYRTDMGMTDADVFD